MKTVFAIIIKKATGDTGKLIDPRNRHSIDQNRPKPAKTKINARGAPRQQKTRPDIGEGWGNNPPPRSGTTPGENHPPKKISKKKFEKKIKVKIILSKDFSGQVWACSMKFGVPTFMGELFVGNFGVFGG